MRNIRLGNDIRIGWTVTRNGQPEEFSGKELTLLMSNEYRTQEVTDYEVQDNVLSFTFLGKDQKSLGSYSFTLIENNGEEGMYTLDACDAFKLVARSCMEGGETCDNLKITTVQLSGDISAPANGLSAYEIAVKNGFVGTEQEWLASLVGPKGDALTYEDLTPAQIEDLQRPATDAAKLAVAAATKADEAGNKANTAAEAANQAVEDMAAEFAKKQDVLISGETIKKVNGIDVLGNGNIVINPTIMDLKWTTNVATTRKLVPAELRKKGVKIAYRDNNSVYHVEQYQTEAIDDTSWAADSNWKGCRTPMTPYFESVGYSYNLDGVTYGKPIFNDETGFYELNGLTDITEEEMTFIYKYANESQEEYCVGVGIRKARTNIPSQVNFGSGYSTSAYIRSYTNNVFLEILYIPRALGTIDNSLRNNPNLKAIVGNSYLDFRNMKTTNILVKCPKLEQVKVNGINKSTSIFSDKPLLNYKSVSFFIKYAANTDAITITVHPTTYSYLMGTAQPTEQVGGTKEEWQQIVTDATEKQITFATAE